MSLRQTSFCFVCSHLTSGQKDGDELRRNSDVMEILRKTRFPQVHDSGDVNSPQTILEHEYAPHLSLLLIYIVSGLKYSTFLLIFKAGRSIVYLILGN
jgi:hypothetical protein